VRMIVRAAAAVFVCLLQAGVSNSGVCANPTPHEDPYDPKSCETNAGGKLYIALGRNVLALPTSAGIVVVEAQLYSGDDRIPAPDPTQPEGCPDNPRQLTSYAFPFKSAIPLDTDEKTSPNQSLGPQSVRLFSTSRSNALPTDSDPIWRSEASGLDLSRRACAL